MPPGELVSFELHLSRFGEKYARVVAPALELAFAFHRSAREFDQWRIRAVAVPDDEMLKLAANKIVSNPSARDAAAEVKRPKRKWAWLTVCREHR